MKKSKKLSILMFCPQFYPVVGGAERQAEKLAVKLVAAGCQVTILTPRLDLESPDREIRNGVVVERFNVVDLAKRVPIPGIALVNIPVILLQVFWAVRNKLKGVDILHCHIASLLTGGAALAGRVSGLPVLCKAAMADHRSDFGEIEKSGYTGRWVGWLVRRLIPNWVATTTSVKEALVRAGINPDNIINIPNGVEVQSESVIPDTKSNVKRFLYLGRLSANIQRDIPTLVRAFEALSLSYSDIELAIVGDGDLFDKTNNLVQQCQAKSRIYMPGFDNPNKWIAWADCFVLPSRREGLSNALLEAMAAGLPCIANDIPPNREVLDGGSVGMLVPIGDQHSLYQSMRTMVSEPKTAKNYASRSLERVLESYDISIVTQCYLQLYFKLISLNTDNTET